MSNIVFQLVVLVLTIGLSKAHAATYEYSSLESAKCYNVQNGEGGFSATCSGSPFGPLGPIEVELFSGDNENLNFIHAGKRHMAWQYIIDVGSFTFVGGKNRVIEWIKNDDGIVRAIVFRVESQSTGASKLVVLGVTKYEICYFGTVATNQQARSLGETGFCGDYLPSENL
jgi:hypothetical protein